MPNDSTFVCSPANIQTYHKVNLKDNLIDNATMEPFAAMSDDYTDIVSLHSGDIGHTQHAMMNIDTGDHPPIVQKLYILPPKHIQWVKDELENVEKRKHPFKVCLSMVKSYCNCP